MTRILSSDFPLTNELRKEHDESPFFQSINKVKTLNDLPHKMSYDCFNGMFCSSSWTYDDHHCTGCHWKGMGVEDLKNGDDALRAHADRLRQLLTNNQEK